MALLVGLLVGIACFWWMNPPVEHRLRAFMPTAHRRSGRQWPWVARRARSMLERQNPGALTVLIAVLDAGIPVADAVQAASRSTAEPLGPTLRDVGAALALGAPVEQAWRPLAPSPSWQPVIAAMDRSERTGAALSVVLAHAAGEIREERRARTTVAARKAGVRAILPLVTCSLPAFFALGVLPVIAAFLMPLIDQLS